MPGWLWALIAALAALLGLLVLANLGAAEKKITQRVVKFCAVSDPAFRRTVAGLFGPQYLGGNSIETLVNGERIFPAMLQAIAAAERSINFETFIYWSGEIGESFAESLASKARAGVEVNILLDWVGSQRMDSRLLRAMAKAGVRIHRYHPPTWRHLVRMNNRTHRKLLVVDGRVGFTGGVGIADSWLGDGDAPDRWRETHYRIEGPVVAQMQGVFLDNWIKASGELLIGPAYFPELGAAGDVAAQIVASSPSGGAESMHLMVQLAVAAARAEIAISTPYFVPDAMTVAALEDAVGRGVRVRILIAGRNIDSWLARRASQGLWDMLLAAGIEISEFTPARLHWKLLVVDRAWVSVGSMNFDNRSFSLNDEANLNVLDARFAAAQLALFDADLRRARRLSRRRWRRRPRRQRVLEACAALFRTQV
jgi:cardiolipin synthase A/B